MQQIYRLGCDWTDNGHMFIHQGESILINTIEIDMHIAYLKTVSNIEVPTCCTATILDRNANIHSVNTPFVYE